MAGYHCRPSVVRVDYHDEAYSRLGSQRTGALARPRSTIELWERPFGGGGRPGVCALRDARTAPRARQEGRCSPESARDASRLFPAGAPSARSSRIRRCLRLPRSSSHRACSSGAVGCAPGCPIIYSLDDPLYVPYVSPSNGWLSYLKFFGKVASICRLSQVVIVNSRFHRDYAEKYNRHVRQIPSLVDERIYRYRPERPHGPPVCVGWSGSPSTATNLGWSRVPRELTSRAPYRLHLIGAERLEVPGVECTAHPWRAETEVTIWSSWMSAWSPCRITNGIGGSSTLRWLSTWHWASSPWPLLSALTLTSLSTAGMAFWLRPRAIG